MTINKLKFVLNGNVTITVAQLYQITLFLYIYFTHNVQTKPNQNFVLTFTIEN